MRVYWINVVGSAVKMRGDKNVVHWAPWLTERSNFGRVETACSWRFADPRGMTAWVSRDTSDVNCLWCLGAVRP